MKIEIREAQWADFDAVAELARQVQNLHAAARPDLYLRNDEPMNRDDFRELLGKDDVFLFVAADPAVNKIKAYTQFRVVNTLAGNGITKDRKILFIDSLVVNESDRNVTPLEKFLREALKKD